MYICIYVYIYQGAAEEEKEELSNKFKLIKEAYETLSDTTKRNGYDSGAVKPPPGGWYQVGSTSKMLGQGQF